MEMCWLWTTKKVNCHILYLQFWLFSCNSEFVPQLIFSRNSFFPWNSECTSGVNSELWDINLEFRIFLVILSLYLAIFSFWIQRIVFLFPQPKNVLENVSLFLQRVRLAILTRESCNDLFIYYSVAGTSFHRSLMYLCWRFLYTIVVLVMILRVILFAASSGAENTLFTSDLLKWSTCIVYLPITEQQSYSKSISSWTVVLDCFLVIVA